MLRQVKQAAKYVESFSSNQSRSSLFRVLLRNSVNLSSNWNRNSSQMLPNHINCFLITVFKLKKHTEQYRRKRHRMRFPHINVSYVHPEGNAFACGAVWAIIKAEITYSSAFSSFYCFLSFFSNVNCRFKHKLYLFSPSCFPANNILANNFKKSSLF